jgi:hypothetical protein
MENTTDNLDKFELSDMLMIVYVMCKLFKEQQIEIHKKEVMKEKYKLLMTILCSKIMRILHCLPSTDIINYEKLVISVKYYRNHKIDTEIKLLRSGIVQLLSEIEKTNIKNLESKIKEYVNDNNESSKDEKPEKVSKKKIIKQDDKNLEKVSKNKQ